MLWHYTEVSCRESWVWRQREHFVFDQLICFEKVVRLRYLEPGALAALTHAADRPIYASSPGRIEHYEKVGGMVRLPRNLGTRVTGAWELFPGWSLCVCHLWCTILTIISACCLPFSVGTPLHRHFYIWMQYLSAKCSHCIRCAIPIIGKWRLDGDWVPLFHYKETMHVLSLNIKMAKFYEFIFLFSEGKPFYQWKIIVCFQSKSWS